VSAGIEITDFILNDQKTMMDLAGSIGFEFAKSGLTSLIAYGAGAWVGGMVGLAVAPLGVMLVVAFGVGVLLSELDNKYLVKQKVLKAFNALPATMEQGVYELRDTTLHALEHVKRDVQRKLEGIKDDINREANRAIDSAARAVLEAVERELKMALQRLLQPRIR
jgi:hypothetical protein